MSAEDRNAQVSTDEECTDCTTREGSFDALARSLANGTVSRRQAMRLVGGALVGSALALIPGVARAAPQGPNCLPLGHKCSANVQCCSRYCDKRGKQCICPPETEIACNNRCVPTCDDPADPCTVSLCDPTTGRCVVGNAPNGTPCDDGNLCTVGDTCNNGTCQPGDPLDCSVGDTECTEGFCDEATGTCDVRNRPDGSSCDLNPCTTGETCLSGVCQGGSPVADCCESANDCPTPDNQCQQATCIENVCGVANKDDGTECDDNLACTTGETCLAGVCQGGTSNCSATSTNNFCCGALTSRPGMCRQTPGTVCTMNNQCCTRCTGNVRTPGVCV